MGGIAREEGQLVGRRAAELVEITQRAHRLAGEALAKSDAVDPEDAVVVRSGAGPSGNTSEGGALGSRQRPVSDLGDLSLEGGRREQAGKRAGRSRALAQNDMLL